MGDDDLLGRVVMHGYAYEYRNRQTGEIHYLDPAEVTVVLPKPQADEYPHTWEARALKAETRVAELERQRDAVLALHQPVETPARGAAPARVQCDHCKGLCHSDSGLHCDEPYDAPWPCPTIQALEVGR